MAEGKDFIVDMREYSQGHQEESRAWRENSRVNMASRMDLVMGVEGKRGAGERAPREEEKRNLRGCMAKMAGYIGIRNWVKGGP